MHLTPLSSPNPTLDTLIKSNAQRKFGIHIDDGMTSLIHQSHNLAQRARVVAAIRDHARNRDPKGNPDGLFDT